MKNNGSALGGALFVMLSLIVLFLLGAMLLISGHSALEAGEISVRYARKGTSVLLRPEANPWWFYGEVWVRLVLGALLMAACVAVPIMILVMSPARRAERLRAASQVGLRPSPRVPWPIVGVVIAGFVAFLVLAT
ncbi:hypothetical protein [Roseateles sp.]|uniref:hypothetical protein n=1 Tax=Roseateles sp. TaxID=1971397 RepID=UPI0032639451